MEIVELRLLYRKIQPPLSLISPAQNNKASSLTNFFRNWGGSFGIAFITTFGERPPELPPVPRRRQHRRLVTQPAAEHPPDRRLSSVSRLLPH
jgi:hypothetical protein